MTESKKGYCLSLIKRLKEKISALDVVYITLYQLLTDWDFDELDMSPIEEMYWDLKKAIKKGNIVIEECYLPKHIRRNTEKKNAKFIMPE